MHPEWPLILFTFFLCVAGGALGAQGLLNVMGKGKKMQLASLVTALAVPISSFFIGEDPALVELTASHFLPLLVCAPFGFMAQVASAYFQAVGQERTSIVLGICRYLLFAIPLIVALAALEGITGVWWSQPPADLLAAALAVALAARECRKLKRADADTSASASALGAPEGEALVEGA